MGRQAPERYDGSGDLQSFTDAEGGVTDAYGEIKTNTNPWFIEQPLLKYAGEQDDPETGLIYLRARYHDPATGQFMSQDPLVDLTRDAYGYVGANPSNVVDPSGMCWGPGCWVEHAVDGVIDVAGYVSGAPPRQVSAAREEAHRQLTPDYVAVDTGPVFLIFGATVTITRDGRVYVGWIETSPGISARAGYLNMVCDTPEDRSAAANGATTTISQGLPVWPGAPIGLSFAESYVWGGTASEIGLGSPGTGYSHSHSRFLFRLWWFDD